jgi:hypothetical protein
MNVRRFELRVDVSHAVPSPGSELAVTLVVPHGDLSGPRNLALAFPGGGYSRGYWDIRWPATECYSEAEYHAERGWLVAAIDHLGVGDSSLPDPSDLTFETLAAANAAASRAVVDGLRAGTLVDGLGPVEIARSIGMGQSMGGCLTIVAQAARSPFDAVAILGFSGIQTVLPSPEGGVEVEHIERGSTDEAALTRSSAQLSSSDVFSWAFHWDDVEPALLDADLGNGYPLRLGTQPPWGSATVPPSAVSMLSPGVVAGGGRRDHGAGVRRRGRAGRVSRSVGGAFGVPRESVYHPRRRPPHGPHAQLRRNAAPTLGTPPRMGWRAPRPVTGVMTA